MLNKENLELLRPFIVSVWEEIASDLIEANNGKRVPNKQAIECCIDADRLSHARQWTKGEFSGKNAQQLLDQMIMNSDYLKVLNFLSKHIKLS